jgi:hypothetical protein
VSGSSVVQKSWIERRNHSACLMWMANDSRELVE